MYVPKKNTLVVTRGPNMMNGGPQAMGDGFWAGLAEGLTPASPGFPPGMTPMPGALPNRDLQAAMAAHSSGPSFTDLAILGGLGYLGYRLLFRKKAA